MEKKKYLSVLLALVLSIGSIGVVGSFVKNSKETDVKKTVINNETAFGGETEAVDYDSSTKIIATKELGIEKIENNVITLNLLVTTEEAARERLQKMLVAENIVLNLKDKENNGHFDDVGKVVEDIDYNEETKILSFKVIPTSKVLEKISKSGQYVADVRVYESEANKEADTAGNAYKYKAESTDQGYITGTEEAKEPEATKALVIYEMNGVTETKEVTIGDKYDLPTPTKTGYTFKGWYTTDGKLIDADSVYEEEKPYVVVTAKWEINKYTVTYNSNGGSKVAKKTAKYGSKYTLPTPKKTGYTFKGWYTKKTGGTKITTAKKVTKNITLYAQWNIKKFTVKYNSNGGSKVTKKTATYGSKYTLPTPKKKGYKFKGWYTKKTGGTKITKSKKVTKNITLYAQWKKK